MSIRFLRLSCSRNSFGKPLCAVLKELNYQNPRIRITIVSLCTYHQPNILKRRTLRWIPFFNAYCKNRKGNTSTSMIEGNKSGRPAKRIISCYQTENAKCFNSTWIVKCHIPKLSLASFGFHGVLASKNVCALLSEVLTWNWQRLVTRIKSRLPMPSAS